MYQKGGRSLLFFGRCHAKGLEGRGAREAQSDLGIMRTGEREHDTDTICSRMMRQAAAAPSEGLDDLGTSGPLGCPGGSDAPQSSRKSPSQARTEARHSPKTRQATSTA